MLDPHLRDLPPELFEEPEPANPENGEAGAESGPGEDQSERPKWPNLREIRARIQPTTKAGCPLSEARDLLNQAFTTGDKLRTLVRYRGDFLVWGYDGASYSVLPEQDIRALIYELLAKENPKRDDVSNTLDALRAVCEIGSGAESPMWLRDVRGFGYDPNECLIARDTIVHLPSGRTHPATPLLFATSAIPTSYDPKAPQPAAWLGFLRSVWPSDQQSIDTLQETFGYLLTTDTSQQKAFLMIGPKRSGKGTIARVLASMLGKNNIAGPTLNSLSTNFGLQPLIGKQVAIISDARLSGKADQSTIAERVLSISGEDALTIDRKHRESWTGTLKTRFLILSNELPRLSDASGALSSRFILLQMTRSFYGQEDLGLGARVLAELPGILQWSIAGLHRLRKRGYFVQPASSADAIDELDALTSPIKAFIADRCTIDPKGKIECGNLYARWRLWCEQEGRERPGTSASFGRDLRSAVPGLKSARIGPEDDRGPRYYVGIR